VIEARRDRGDAVDGPSVRKALAAKLGGPYSTLSGYGILTVGVV
jgi:hypothetical protein